MNKTCLLAAVALGVWMTACAEREDAPAAAASASDPVPIPAQDLNWTDLDPEGAPGVEIARLWGDHATEGFGAMFKLPAGFAGPLHTHTNDMKAVIVSGTYIQGPDGAAEFRLGPGSYLLQPGGDYRHTTRCDAASDCIFFVESEGPFDLHVVRANVDSTAHR